MDLLTIADTLVEQLKGLRFSPPVTHVYNPLEYARAPYRRYIKCYGRGTREVILLGMNPGPWGMVQTGVPFGEVNLVRDWLGIEGKVRKPEREHPKRPVEGFGCRRSEVSGARLWGWVRDTFRTPERFFKRFFIANYCPLAFLESSGRNRTPDRLAAKEKSGLFAACDGALVDTVRAMRPRFVVGVGKFAEDRAIQALDGLDVRIGRILHPSPANPEANRGWVGRVSAELTALGVTLPDVGPRGRKSRLTGRS
jgi:single-strand selective monofunctional uracil DNA glycosylase